MQGVGSCLDYKESDDRFQPEEGLFRGWILEGELGGSVELSDGGTLAID